MNVVSFAVGGAGQAIGALGGIAEALGASEDALKLFSGAALAADIVIKLLASSFGLFVGANEELNQQLLKTQSLLLTNTDLFNAAGQPITNLTEGIRASKDQLKGVLKDLQKDTESLVGVTSAEVNEVFGYVNRNIGSLVNQSQKSDDVLESARRVTKVLVAAGGVSGIRGGQFAQESRALLSGDINNADATIIKDLGITKQDFEKARKEGRLVEYIEEKGAGAVAANAEASKSISGITSNIQEVFESVSREAGEDLLGPIVDGLDEVYQFIKDNRDLIQEGVTTAVAKVFALIQDVVGAVRNLFEAWQPILQVVGEGIAQSLDVVLQGFGNLARSIGTVGSAIGRAFSALVPFAKLVNETATGFQDIVDARASIANEFNPLGFNSNVATGRKMLSSDRSDGDEALNTILTSTETQSAFLTTERVDSLKKEKPGGVKATGFKLTTEALEARTKELEGLTLYSDESRERRDSMVAKYKKQVEEIKEYAKSQNVNIDGSITFQPKKLREQAEAAQAVLEDYQSSLEKLDEERGVQVDYDKMAEGFAKTNQLLKDQGVISLDVATADLEAFVSNEKVKAETRLAAQKQLLQYYDQQEARQKKIADIDIAAGKALVATGKISAEDGAVVSTRGEQSKLKSEEVNIQRKIASNKELKLDTKDLEQELELNEKKQEEFAGKLVDDKSKAFQADIQRIIDKGTRALKQLEGERKLEVAKQDGQGKLTGEDRAVLSVADEIKTTQDERLLAEQELSKLQAAPLPASMAERLSLEKKIAQAKLEVTQLTEKGITLEARYRDQVAARAVAEIEFAARRRDRAIGDEETVAATDRARDSLSTTGSQEAVAQNENDVAINSKRLASNRQQKQALLEAPRAATKDAQRKNDERLAQLDSDYLKLTQREVELTVSGVKTRDAAAEDSIRRGIAQRMTLFETETLAQEESVLSSGGTEADREIQRTKNAAIQSKARVDLARQELKDLESLQPADIDDQRKLEQDTLAARQRLLQASNASIQAEIKLKQQLLQENQKLKQIEFERVGLQGEALGLQSEVGRQVLANLERQVDVEKELQSLATARVGLQLQLQQNKVATLGEAKKLLETEAKAREEGNSDVANEAQRQRRELGFADNDSERTVAKKTLEESTKLLDIQINAEQQKLNFARQAFDFEQQKTKLALEQEAIAARRRLIEGQINTEKLKLQKEQALADESLTTEQRMAQVDSIDKQIELSSASQLLDQSAVNSTDRQMQTLGSMQRNQSNAFALNESATIAQKNYEFGAQNRSNRLQFAQDGGQIYNLNNKVGQIGATTSNAPLMVRDPELLSAIGKLNELLSRENSGVTVVNNFPELSASRAMQRIAGY